MNSVKIFYLIIFASLGNCFAISIADAVSNKALQVKFENIGKYSGLTTDITLLNTSNKPITLTNNDAFIIESEDSTSQDLVVADHFIVTIKPKETFKKRLTTYCLHSNRAGPTMNEQYYYTYKIDTNLRAFMRFVFNNKGLEGDNQHAVWAYANGNKTLLIDDVKDAKKLALKHEVEKRYATRLSNGEIKEDKGEYLPGTFTFSIDGTYQFFTPKEGTYTAKIVDSLHTETIIFNDKKLPIGLNLIRYMHQYAAITEKRLYLVIESNNAEIARTLATNRIVGNKYIRLSARNQTIFNIKNEITARLDLVDSLDNIYINFFENKKMYPGIRSFDYSFKTIKPEKGKLYLVLKNEKNVVLSKQDISNLENSVTIQGYSYIRLNRRANATFGLYDANGNLLEEFKKDNFQKGLQMLPYGFVALKGTKLYVRVVDNITKEVLYDEPILMK